MNGSNHYNSGYTSTYTACHEHNAYISPFTQPGNLSIAGSAGWKMVKDCDLIINLDAAFKPLLSPPEPPKPTVKTSSEFWEELTKHEFPIEAKEEAVPKKIAEVIDIRWNDFKIPNLTPAFWQALWLGVEHKANEHPDKEYEILFTCQGGHGRTGTSMACFLVASGIYDPLSAIKWVRENYCKSAVENMDQEKYLWYVGAAFLQAEGHDANRILALKEEYEKWCNKNFPSKSTVPASAGYAKGSSSPQRWDHKLQKWIDIDDKKSDDNYDLGWM